MSGRIYVIERVKSVWRLADGREAEDWEADGIAIGAIQGSRDESREIITHLGPCSERQARSLYLAWYRGASEADRMSAKMREA